MRIDTARLVLRPFTLNDKEAVISLLSNPVFMEWSIHGVYTADDARNVLRHDVEEQAERGFSKYAVIDKSTGHIVGYCGISVMEVEGMMLREIGYRLLPEARGRGIATEATSAVIRDGFDRCNLPSIDAIVEPGNLPSIRILDVFEFEFQRMVEVKERKWRYYRLKRPA